MNHQPESEQFDVVIVGGSYAGLSAALPLARARRRVAIVDAGHRRNEAALESHGFLTRDGESSAEIARIGREQVLAYPTVTWIDAAATNATGSSGDFTISTDTGQTLRARLLVLAMGVKDTLPDIPGLAERWGDAVFDCPYCHGYELHQGSMAVIASGPQSCHQAWMLSEWGRVTFFTNNAIDLDEKQRSTLDRLDVMIEPESINAVENHADVRLADGRLLSFKGIAVTTSWSINSDLPAELNLEMDETPDGTLIKVDEMQATSVEGIFACGDVTQGAHSVAVAVANGFVAGVGAHSTILDAR